MTEDEKRAVIARGESLRVFLEDPNIQRWFDTEVGAMTNDMLNAAINDNDTRRDCALAIRAIKALQQSIKQAVERANKLAEEHES